MKATLEGTGALALPRPATRRRRDDPRLQAIIGLAVVLPLRGTVVRPAHMPAIIVGVASRNLGRRHIGAFTVRYHVGPVRYEATFQIGIDIHVVARCPAWTDDGRLAGRLR